MIYFRLGYEHITDLAGLDHLVFILALIAGASIKDWKNLLKIVTAFTVGHSISLAIAALEWINLSDAQINGIEFLIPVTIMITSLSNVVKKTSANFWMVIFFGLIHGLGFSNFLKEMFSDNLLGALLGFNIGLEAGQVVFLCLCLGLFWLFQRLFVFEDSKRNIFISGGTFFVSLMMIIEKIVG